MTSKDKKPRILPGNRTFVAVALLSLICFIGILLARSSFEATNLAVNSWIPTVQNPILTQAAQVLNFFDTTVLLVFSLPVVGYLFYRRQTKYGLMLLAAMAADALLLQVLKTMVVSPRPLNALIVEGDYSFPSGHLTSILVLLGMLTYIAYQTNKPAFKILAVATPVLGVLMALDRLYLNIHWLSDVIAAPFLALFIMTATIVIIESLAGWHGRRRVAIKGAVGEK
jgi:membrane-associated phospholipid phosphatase